MKKKKLTPKQEKFAHNVAKGMTQKDAAIKAGYSEKKAIKTGYELASKTLTYRKKYKHFKKKPVTKWLLI